MNKTKEQRANEIAEELLGSSRYLSQVTTDAEREDRELMELVEEKAVPCEQCGWWVEADEVDEDGNCETCQEDE